MKKLFTLFAIATLLFGSGCSKKYDDSALTGRVDNLEGRVDRLEELCRQMNTNISSLQTLVAALQSNDYVTGVTPVTKNGETVGYTISFTKSAPITIYHGEKGQDGHTPIIGVRQDTDGIHYWTHDGEWLLDSSNNKIKAEGRDGQDGVNGTDGKDGIAPQLKIEDGCWFVSTDNGATWTNLGKATGEDGKDGQDGVNGTDGKDGADGDSFFQSVDTSSSEYVIFTLADGTTIKLPTWYAFEQLKTLCNQMNTNIGSLQTIVEALQKNDCITSCTPLMENGEQIGYTITFSKSNPIIIYHGQDGIDGSNGTDGKDGHSPVIGAKTDTDGTIYWTIDGEWLTDEGGDKIPVQGRDGSDGKDAIAPQLKIEEGYWHISYNNGASWTQLGKATGEDGKDGQDGVNGTDGKDGADGDSFFQSVDTSSSEYVIFTLADGTTIKLPTWYAFEQLKTLCNQMNTNIGSLQTIVEALQKNDCITSCTPLMENGEQIGYTITFSKSNPIIIYHGQDGIDGSNGTDGKDGHSPVIGAKTDTDGTIYWTIDGEWLTDEGGDKIPVQGRDGANGSDGKDAITPQLKIEEGYWHISYNNGASWTQLGKATGEDGKDGQDGVNGTDGKDGADGDAFFRSVTQDEDYVYLTLSTGEKISVPKHRPLSVVFDETEDIRVLADKTYSIGYTIAGADENTVIKALAQDGFRAVVKKTDNATGTIEITTPSTILPTEILVFVTDGKERTIMRSINFVEGVILITTKSYTVGYDGGTVSVDLSTNIDYNVEIPEADKEWITLADTRTRAVMRDETLTFTVAPNPALSVRYSAIRLVDALGVTGETILITQKSGTSQTIHVATAGTLYQLIDTEDKDIIEELTVTGTLNIFDYEFINTMKNVKLVDLSTLNNTSIPTNAFASSNISTVILPLKLKVIANRSFYNSAITSLYIPETVETIGDYAFANTKFLSGNLVIPNTVTHIGSCAFQNSKFNGTLNISQSIQNIGAHAFENCKNATGDLIIPNTLTTLGESAFANSTFSGNLIIGNSVKVIPANAFYGCSKFSGSIRIGESVSEIGNSAFEGCSGFTGNLTIPDKVITIGERAFYACTGFTGYLSLGVNLSNIGAYSFIARENSSYTKYQETHDNRVLYVFTYSYRFTKLNFSVIYSKCSTPPTLSYGEFDYSHTDQISPKTSYYYPIFGGYEMYVDQSSFPYNHYRFSGTYPTYLYVPIGSKTAYTKADGWNRFQIIEEIEF